MTAATRVRFGRPARVRPGRVAASLAVLDAAFAVEIVCCFLMVVTR